VFVFVFVFVFVEEATVVRIAGITGAVVAVVLLTACGGEGSQRAAPVECADLSVS